MNKDKTDFTKINLSVLAADYSDEERAYSLFEELRWPEGAKCYHCAADKPYRLNLKSAEKRPARRHLYKCRKCRKQFTAMMGTILEKSHIPVQKWLMAFFLVSNGKKSLSAHQLHRALGIDYKSAWFMYHRIRHAFKPESEPEKLKGQVEVDEGFVGGVQPINPETKKRVRKAAVVALVERGGNMRVKVVDRVSSKSIGDFLRSNVAKGSTLNTDGNPHYGTIYLPGIRHESVNHSIGEMKRERADGSKVHVNSCESFFSLLKRGITGSFHHVSKEHLHRYCDEFAFRWNTRELTDGERMATAIGMTDGKRLTYTETVSA